jgi:DNA modification methylase
MVDVFREVRRVLRSDGTAWINLGDSYQNAKGQAHGVDPKQPARRHGLRPQDVSIEGLKPKDLVGIPWRVAFALQADGWWLRQDIIWSKPNPMPESVTDRCTKAHEYLFLLSKSERYFYDAEAIKELGSKNSHGGVPNNGGAKQEALGKQASGRLGVPAGGRKRGRPDGAPTFAKFGHNTSCGTPEDGYRNKRSVWEIATSPFPEAHFATFPPGLIEPCILSGCPKGGTVLDPFGGAGTTGLVAHNLNREAILIELNPEYVAMADRRIHGPLFAGQQAQQSGDQSAVSYSSSSPELES